MCLLLLATPIVALHKPVLELEVAGNKKIILEIYALQYGCVSPNR
jgi:hypothetical protein